MTDNRYTVTQADADRAQAAADRINARADIVASHYPHNSHKATQRRHSTYKFMQYTLSEMHKCN